MFGIGLPEMIVILAVALIVVGPDKLPELARSLAKGVNELKGTLNQVKENLSEETKVINSVKEDLQKTAVQLKDNLLEEESTVWRTKKEREDGDSERGTKAADADIIEMEPGQDERPWEKDAAAPPEQISESEQEITQEGTQKVASEPVTPDSSEQSADENAKSTDIVDNKDNSKPSTAA